MPRARSPRVVIRAAGDGDAEFILSLVPRFVAFPLPPGRRKRDCTAAIHADIERALRTPGKDEAFFICENAQGERVGFLHLQVLQDFFARDRNCHISDLAVAPGHDGQGLGRALLDHAAQWAKKKRCRRLTLAVFPGNARARALYAHAGFSDDLVRMQKPLSTGGRQDRSNPLNLRRNSHSM